MAFSLNCNLTDVEYRACKGGTSQKTGKPWMTLVFEDTEANQLEASVPADMQGDIYSLSLRKGDLCNINILAVARADGSSFVMLRALPEVVSEVDF